MSDTAPGGTANMHAEAAMRRDRTAGIVVLAAGLLGLAACGLRGPKAPGREVVTPLLQEEAN